MLKREKYNIKSIKDLIDIISEEFNGILRANLYEIGLDEIDLIRLRNKKRELRGALKCCGIGDKGSKNYIKSAIKDILLEKDYINKDNINDIIHFETSKRLSVMDMFDILLYKYIREFEDSGLSVLIEKYNLYKPKELDDGFIYKITKEDIESIYYNESYSLTFNDKLDILVQRIYSSYRGLGIIDDIRDQIIDGVSGGVSGGEKLDSVWIFYKGKSIHLSFLNFSNEVELERICMNIYRYGHPGQLSRTKGYIVNEMKDNSRVVVVRPPFSESFAFFVRKFDSVKIKTVNELFTCKGSDKIHSLLKWIVKGCQVVGLTGSQGSGKTTLLMSLISYIHPSYAIRVQELAFELNLRKIYKDRNILTFRETDHISGQEGLDLQKKTDGVVNILGEVATAPVSAWLVQMSMVASLFTMFTHHAKTTDDLIKHMRNSLLSCGLFKDELIACEQVVEAIRFDVHMNKDIEGNRYIERITEIVPYLNEHTNLISYKKNELIEYVDDEYRLIGKITKQTAENIIANLTKKQVKEFYEELYT